MIVEIPSPLLRISTLVLDEVCSSLRTSSTRLVLFSCTGTDAQGRSNDGTQALRCCYSRAGWNRDVVRPLREEYNPFTSARSNEVRHRKLDLRHRATANFRRASDGIPLTGGEDEFDFHFAQLASRHCPTDADCSFGSRKSKEYLKGDRPQQRGYSEAVITEGGKTVWLAGQTATVDDNGKSLASDFEGQVRQLFKNLDRTLQKAGGKLSDMVQMTVFITDVRYGDRLTQIRREVFGDNFPGSALITITALAVPDAKIEIQGYAVIGGK